MKEKQTIGIIACGDSELNSLLQDINRRGTETVSAVCVTDEIAFRTSKALFPEASVVYEQSRITEDPRINTVIICTPEKENLPLIAACLKANKAVQVLHN